jgi:putative membrane protein
MLSEAKIKRARIAIIIASLAIPLVVAILFGVNLRDLGFDVQPLTFLPPIYATINGVTALLLVLALVAIKRKNRKVHEGLIKICMILSLLFLGCYVAYHMTSDSTVYGDTNGDGIRDAAEKAAVAGSLLVYTFILLSHILLSVVIIPIVLFTYLFAWQGNYVRHKKWTRFAWPMWFYVAVTGVIVYLMISPYYS